MMHVLSTPSSSLLKVLYNPKAFFIHAAWLHQACAHCAIFPTAASRRSLDRVSVPVWLIILSDQLGIVALVSPYLTNQLIPPGHILTREARRSPSLSRSYYAVLAIVSNGYPPHQGNFPGITHPSAARRRYRPPKVQTTRFRSTCMCQACRQRSI